MKKLKVLLIAEAANPEWASVPLVGWSHARALADVVDAHVVTQIRNKEAFERAGLTEGKDFTSIDSERIAQLMWKLSKLLRGGSGKGWTTATALSVVSYAYFEKLFWERFGARIRAKEFDVVHRLTPLSPTTPSLIAKRCRAAGVPFVLGPLNGGVPWPAAFDSARRKEKEWLSYVRGVYKLLPWYRSTRSCASAIIIGSRDTWAQMGARYIDKCVYIPENAIDPGRFQQVRSKAASKPIRVMFLGRLVPYKGADMMLEAASSFIRDGQVVLDFVGDGPQREELQSKAKTAGIEGQVVFHGWVPHQQVQSQLSTADIFGFPSIREFGGGAVLEAMATGVVPLIVAYGGPAELVTERTGWTVPIGSRAEIVEALRTRLAHIVANPDEIDEKSKAAKQRARSLYTWDAKAQQVLEVYKWVRGMRDRPSFGMPFPEQVGADTLQDGVAVSNER